MTYVMITPIKNEIRYIDRTVLSVLNQTERPALWLFIDGGSTDTTREYLHFISREYDWIKVIDQEDSYYDSVGNTHMNVAIAVYEGYEFIKKYCAENGIPFEYIWTIDADQVLEPDVCRGVIHELSLNMTIGAASGQVLNPDGSPDTYPEGELPNKRVYRKEAIDRIGGFPLSKYSYDTALLAKLRIEKWGIKSFPLYTIVNLRTDSGIERNTWKSAKQFGRARYYLGYSWTLLILGCGYLVLHKKLLKSVGVFCGYAGSVMRGDEVTKDQQVWNHFHNERINEIWIEPKYIGVALIFTVLVLLVGILWRFR